MGGPEDAEHVLVVRGRRGLEAVAPPGLHDHVVVLGEGLARPLGLVGVGRRALAQRLADVAAAAGLEAGEDVLLGAGEVDHDRLVVGDGRQDGVGLGQLGADGQANEDDLGIAGAHALGDRGERGGLLLGGGLGDPGGTVAGAQVVVAMGLEVEEAHEGDGRAVLLDHEGAPLAAAGDGVLVAGPHLRLLDGQLAAEALCLGLQLIEADLSKLHGASKRARGPTSVLCRPGAPRGGGILAILRHRTGAGLLCTVATESRARRAASPQAAAAMSATCGEGP